MHFAIRRYSRYTSGGREASGDRLRGTTERCHQQVEHYPVLRNVIWARQAIVLGAFAAVKEDIEPVYRWPPTTIEHIMVLAREACIFIPATKRDHLTGVFSGNPYHKPSGQSTPEGVVTSV